MGQRVEHVPDRIRSSERMDVEAPGDCDGHRHRRTLVRKARAARRSGRAQSSLTAPSELTLTVHPGFLPIVAWLFPRRFHSGHLSGRAPWPHIEFTWTVRQSTAP